MKKFYTLILSLAVCCFTASAADWDIVLNVIEGAERVKAVVGENADDTDVQVIELVNGENKIHIPSYEALYFIPYNESDIVILKDSTGETITKSMWDKYFQDTYLFEIMGFEIAVADELLAEALKALPQDRLEIILLSYFADMTDKEIAGHLNLIRRTVAHRRKNALRKLKKIMEGFADE